jgi:hypothetical protein
MSDLSSNCGHQAAAVAMAAKCHKQSTPAYILDGIKKFLFIKRLTA